MVTLICKRCGKEYNVLDKRKNSSSYCSVECVKSGFWVNCATCGKELYVKNYRKKNNNYCSTKCWTTSEDSKKIVSETMKKSHKEKPRIGELSGSWLGGITPDHKKRLMLTKWKKLAEEVKKLDGYKCVNCNSNKNLVVHHIIPFRYCNTDATENLMTLCNKCHSKADALVRKYLRIIDNETNKQNIETT